MEKERLPPQSAKAPMPKLREDFVATGGSEKPAVLLVEYDENLLSLLEQVVKLDPALKDHDVITAKNGSEALKAFEQNKGRVVAVVTDLPMDVTAAGIRIREGLSKGGFVNAVRETSKGVGIAAYSVLAPTDEEKSRMGLDEHLQKRAASVVADYQALVKRMVTLTEQRQPRKLRQ